jgi:hypothetical protein
MSVPNNAPATVGVSPKMVAATVVTTVVGVIVALLNALQADASLLGGLNPVLQFIVLTAIPPVLAGFAAYQARPGDVVGGTGPIAPGAVRDDLSGI